MRVPGTIVACIVAVMAAGSVACPSLDPFECSTASACDLNPDGACADGYCAYPDDACPSDLRWHDAAPGVGGTCVPASTADDSGTDPSASSSSSAGETTAAPPQTTSSGEVDSTTGAEQQCSADVTLRVDTNLLAGNLVLDAYPLLVDVSDPGVAFAQRTGADIFFTDLDGNVLPHELEAVEGQRLRAWVRLPTWKPGLPLDIVLHAGDADDTPVPDPDAVWPETFVGVWHLDEPLTGSRTGDLQRNSASADFQGRTGGMMAAEQLVDGVVGPALFFDGIDDIVNVDDRASEPWTTLFQSISVSVWTRVDDPGGVDLENPIFERGAGHSLYPRARRRPDGNDSIQAQVGVNGGTIGVAPDGFPFGEFRHLVLVLDAEEPRFRVYFDGTEVAANDPEANPVGPHDEGNGTPLLGRFGEYENSLLGIIDEFRVADSALSPAWIAADVISQRQPELIVSVVETVLQPCP